MVYTLVEPGLRDAMRQLCRRARVHYCDLLGHPIDSISRVAGVAARMEPGARAPLDSDVLQAHRGDRVRGEVRRRRRARARRGRHRARRRLAHVEDAALDLSSATSGTRRRTSRSCAASTRRAELFEIDPAKIVGLTIDAERLAEIRTRPREDRWARRASATRSSRRSTTSSRRRRSSTSGSAAP